MMQYYQPQTVFQILENAYNGPKSDHYNGVGYSYGRWGCSTNPRQVSLVSIKASVYVVDGRVMDIHYDAFGHPTNIAAVAFLLNLILYQNVTDASNLISDHLLDHTKLLEVLQLKENTAATELVIGSQLAADAVFDALNEAIWQDRGPETKSPQY